MHKPQGENEPLDRAEIHTVLSNDRRWRTLELLSKEAPRDLRSLANEIAAAESGESPAPRDVRQSVYVTLHQNHLPRLESLDIVEYDDTSKMVTLDGRASEINGYLDTEPSGQFPCSTYHIGVVVLGLLTTAGSVIGIPLLAAFNPVVYAAGALLFLVLSIGFQMRSRGSPLLERLSDR